MHLQLFGGLRVETSAQLLAGRAAQKKRLALLAILGAAPGAALAREKLAALLWSEADSERARHQVAACVYDLRRALGEDALLAVADELQLNPQRVVCDVCAFHDALARGDAAEAARLYRGPFLDGFFLSGAPEFESWVESERARLERLHAGALESLALGRAQAGDGTGAIDAWRRLAAHEPLNSRVALLLANALDAARDPAGALQHLDGHVRRVRLDLGIEPPAELMRTYEEIRARTMAVPTVRAARVAPTSEPMPALTAAPHRRRLLRAAVLLLPLALLSHSSVSLAPPPDPAGYVVAVFPFAVRGSEDAEFLGRGFAELLGRSLDEAGERAVDHATIIRSLAVPDAAAELTPERAGAIARRLGARHFVVGSVTQRASSIRTHVALYDAARPQRPTEEITVAGEAAEAFALVDRVANQLLGSRAQAGSVRLTRAAAVNTPSTTAFRHYLDGEDALRRGNYGEAIAAFQRAVGVDSTFTLAYYRLAVAGGLFDREPNASTFALEGAAPTALERALAYADRLSEHDRRLLDAYAAYRLGRADDAEQRYRALLRDYPDDLEARFQLAEVLFRYNALRGRPPAEAKPYYDQVLAADPESFCPI